MSETQSPGGHEHEHNQHDHDHAHEEQQESMRAEEQSALTTDADRTASATPGGDIDEAGEDEQVGGGLIDRALEEPPG